MPAIRTDKRLFAPGRQVYDGKSLVAERNNGVTTRFNEFSFIIRTAMRQVARGRLHA